MGHFHKCQFHGQPLVLAGLVVDVALAADIEPGEQQGVAHLTGLFGILFLDGVGHFEQIDGALVFCHKQIAQVGSQPDNKMMSIKTFAQNFIQQQEGARVLLSQQTVHHLEIIIIVEYVEVSQHLLKRYAFAGTERDHQVEDR